LWFKQLDLKARHCLSQRQPERARSGGRPLGFQRTFDDHVRHLEAMAIGVTATRSILYDEAKRLRYTDRQAKMDCIA
jgi:hypothetical protein